MQNVMASRAAVYLNVNKCNNKNKFIKVLQDSAVNTNIIKHFASNVMWYLKGRKSSILQT